MAETVGTLKANLVGDSSQFQKAMGEATAGLERFRKTLVKVTAVATAAFAAQTLVIRKLINASEEQRMAELKLATAIRATGNAIDSKRIIAYADALQTVTGQGDELTLELSALLATFGATEDQIISLLPQIANMAASTGKDARRGAQALSVALQTGVLALDRYGLSFTEVEKKQFKLASESERLATLTQRLNVFQGAAADKARSAAAGFDRVSGRIGDLQQAIGKVLDRALLPFVDVIESLVVKATVSFNAVDSEVKELAGAITLATAAITGSVGLTAAFVALGPILLSTGLLLAKIIGLLVLLPALVLTAVGAIDALLDSVTFEKIDIPLVARLASPIPLPPVLIVPKIDQDAKAKVRKELGLEPGQDASIPTVVAGFLERGANKVLGPSIEKFKELLGDFNNDYEKALAELLRQQQASSGRIKAQGGQAQATREETGALIGALPLTGITEGIEARRKEIIERIDEMAALRIAAITEGADLFESDARKVDAAAPDQVQGALGELAAVSGKASSTLSALNSSSPQEALTKLGIAALQESEAFGRLVESTDGIIEALGSLLDVFSPLIDAVGAVTGAIGDVIGGVAEGLGSVVDSLNPFSSETDKATKAVEEFTGSLGDSASDLFDKLTTASEEAGPDPFIGTRAGELDPADVLTGLTPTELQQAEQQAGTFTALLNDRQIDEFQRQAQSALEELEDKLVLALTGQDVGLSADEIQTRMDRINSALEAAGISLEDTVDQMNDSLTNVPRGFKTALRRFQSINEQGPETGAAIGVVDTAGVADASTRTVINTESINLTPTSGEDINEIPQAVFDATDFGNTASAGASAGASAPPGSAAYAAAFSSVTGGGSHVGVPSMPFLTLNGITIPVAKGGEMVTAERGQRGRSPSNRYFLGRNGRVARRWRFQTTPIQMDEARIIERMLMHEGDHWQFAVKGDPDGTSISASDFASDHGALLTTTDDVVAGRAADGRLVINATGAGVTPRESGLGSLGTIDECTNLVSAAAANPETSADLTAVASATLATETSRRWKGAGCVEVTATAGSDGARSGVVAPSGTGPLPYYGGIHLLGAVGGETVRVTVADDVATNSFVDATLSADKWTRVTVAHTDNVATTTLEVNVVALGGAMVFYVDGLQLEQNDTFTAWQDPAAGVRAGPSLEYPVNIWNGIADGSFTVNLWVRYDNPSATARRFVSVGKTGDLDRFDFLLDASDRLEARLRNDGANYLGPLVATSLTQDAWGMVTAVFDATVPSLTTFENGAQVATDTTTSGPAINLANADYFSVGNLDGASRGLGHLTDLSIIPNVVPAEIITAWYQSGAPTLPSGFATPMLAEGDLLPADEGPVAVYGELTRAGYEGIARSGTWENNNRVIAFMLMEAL